MSITAGWSCIVQGKTEPTQFFYGLTLCFDGPPHLSHLKRDIEEAVIGNQLVPGGSEYAIGDIEILDFRLNDWVNLDSRSQLYSGCHLAAIRDTISGTCAGPFEAPQKPLESKLLGFAMEAQKLFEALDAECEGALRLKSVLKSLRHDASYAVDVFSRFDVRATGVVTFQDFISVYHSAPQEFLTELRERVQHGGRGYEGTSSGAAANKRTSSEISTGNVTSPSEVARALIERDEKAGAAEHQSSAPSTNLLQLAGMKGKLKEGEGGGRGTSPNSPSPGAEKEGQQGGGAAKSVVDLLQKSIVKKREAASALPSGTPNLTASVVSKLKGLRKPKIGGGGGGAAVVPPSAGSEAGSASAAGGAGGLTVPTSPSGPGSSAGSAIGGIMKRKSAPSP